MKQSIHVSHILYLSEKPEKNPFSGAENHILTLLPLLVREGIDVELIVLLWNHGPIISNQLDYLAKQGVRITTLSRPDLRWLPVHWLLTRFIRATLCWWKLFLLLGQRKDRIVHLHLDMIALPVLSRLARCKPIVISIHNDEKYFAKFKWRFWLKIVDLMVNQYVAITEHVQHYYLQKTGVNEEKVQVIRYGVLPPRPLKFTRSDFAIPTSKFVVGFVGRLVPQKNLFILIDALACLPDDVLGVFVGAGELEISLKNYAERVAPGKVLFLGSIPEAAGLMPLFDLFCLPSIWEGLGLVLVEAMLQQVPIVASRAGAISEVLGNTYPCLFDPHDHEGLANFISYCRDHPQLAQGMAESAYLRAKEVFSTQRMVDQTVALYRDLIV